MTAVQRLTVLPSCTCCISGYHLPLWAGLGGVFARHGLDVTVPEPSGRLERVRAVADGRYDCCLTSVRNALEARAADPGLTARYVFMVARRSHLAAFTVTAATPARAVRPRDFAALDGASVLAYQGAEYMGLPEYGPLLEHLGLRPGPDVELSSYSELYDGLADRRGAVAVTWLNLLPDVRAAAAARGLAVNVFPFHAAGMVAYGSGVLAGQHLIDDRPDVVGRLVAALRAACRDVRRDPRSALRVFTTRYPDRDPDRAVAVWEAGTELVFDDGPDAAPPGTMTAHGWTQTIAHHARSYGTDRWHPSLLFDARFVGAPTAA